MDQDLPLDSLADVGFAGDWHGNTRWAVAAITYAAHLGIRQLFHAGDYAFRFERDFVEAVDAACIHHDVRILAVRGNHDDPGLIEALPCDDDGLHIVSEHVRMIPDGRAIDLPGGISLVGLGGAPSIDRYNRMPGETWWEGETLADDILRRIPERAEIVLSHDCPDRVDLPLDPAFGDFFERMDPGILDVCDDHRTRLGIAVDALAPTLLVHGHYHMVHNAERPWSRGGGSTRIAGLHCDGTDFRANVRTLRRVWTGQDETAPGV